MTLKDITKLYVWLRENNQHTPDEVINFMYESAKEKFIDEFLSSSINDRLPKEGVYCLTYTPEIDGIKYRVLCTNNGKFFSGVTHWMYLSTPIEVIERLG